MDKKTKSLPEGTIILNDGKEYSYKINEKQKHIAQNKRGIIFVNKEFTRLKNKEHQKTIYYHERGHSFWFNKRLNIFKGIFGIIIILLIIFSTFLFLKHKYLFFFICFFILILLLVFYIDIITAYLIEIICDFNAIKNMGFKNFDNSVVKYYRRKNLKNYYNHPPWKWRRKIMKYLD